MEAPKIFESEYRFCLILWDNEPVSSGKLVELCKEGLGFKCFLALCLPIQIIVPGAIFP